MEVVGISVDEPGDSATLKQRLGIGVPLLSDKGGAAAAAWGVYDPDAEIAIAATFVVAPSGRVLYKYIGKDKTDRPPIAELLAAVDGDHKK